MTSALKKLLLAGYQFTKQQSDTLPTMTNNTSPAGHVASFGYAGSSTGASPATDAYLAFDKADRGTYDLTFGASNPGGWVQRKTPTPIRVWKFGIRARSGAVQQSPKSFALLGSNDGSSFTTLLTVYNQINWSDYQERYFEVPESVRDAYLFHRLQVYSSAASETSGYTSFNEVMLLQEVS